MNHAFTACLTLLTPGRLAGYTFPGVLGSTHFSPPGSQSWVLPQLVLRTEGGRLVAAGGSGNRHLFRNGSEKSAQVPVGIRHPRFDYNPVIQLGNPEGVTLTPAPGFNVTVSKGECPGVIVPGGRKAHPRPERGMEKGELVRRVNAEGALLDALFVLLNEHGCPARSRPLNLSQPMPAKLVARVVPIRPEIHIYAHRHAAIAQDDPLVPHRGPVRRTTVDAERLAVAIQHAFLQVGRCSVCPGIALQPRHRVGRPSFPIADVPRI